MRNAIFQNDLWESKYILYAEIMLIYSIHFIITYLSILYIFQFEFEWNISIFINLFSSFFIWGLLQ